MIQARRPVTPTILSFRRAAISSAISAFSAEDKSRAARGNTKSSSILMCSLYRETRPAIAFRNASTFVDSKLSAARYRCPKCFHLRVQRSGQKMVVFERLKPLKRGFHIRIALLTHSRKQRFFFICGLVGRGLSKVPQRGFEWYTRFFGQRAIFDYRHRFERSEEHFNATVTIRQKAGRVGKGMGLSSNLNRHLQYTSQPA